MAGVWLAAAQLPTYGVGRPPSTEEVQAWDRTIPPDGQGLPPGSGTAALGKAIYAERCASCHGEKGEDPKYILLVGGARTLPADRARLTIGNFWQYATTLWSYLRRAQPFDEPGPSRPTRYAVTASLLQRHHQRAGRHGRADLPLVKCRTATGSARPTTRVGRHRSTSA
jgi:cytochrome c